MLLTIIFSNSKIFAKLKVGFDTIDFGSFVSAKAIPQLSDTAAVLEQLELTSTKLLAIVANVRGAQEALKHSTINYLGFPFSISETFQKRNTNSSIEESWKNVLEMQELCTQKNKELAIYISMAFGNPYKDEWNSDIVVKWTEKMISAGVKTISMADTVGIAKVDDITRIFNAVVGLNDTVEFGVHLHCTPDNWYQKVEAAWNAGCRRFDAAMKGYGGCPFAEDELVGNLSTENLMLFLSEKNIQTNINQQAFDQSLLMASSVFAEPLAT